MFKTLQSTFTRDNDYPARQFRIAMRRRVLEGTIYDKLPHPFHEEKASNGEYIPLRQRRPSVRHGTCGIVVDDSVSMLFSEAHFPEIVCEDAEGTREALAKLVKETGLNEVMIDAATRGSVGSVAIFLRVLEGRVFWEVMNTEYLTPLWKPTAPDTLQSVREQYKVKGSDLRAAGYSVKDDDLNEDHWFLREFTDTQEVFYQPWKVRDEKANQRKPKVDDKRTVSHNLGFVPVAWVKNLTGGDAIDGLATFPDEAVDTAIEIDYQLSQAGRGLKYSSDPTLVIKEPAGGTNGQIIKGAGNALVVGSDGDANLLEINGTAAQAVMEYVELLRKIALEKMHGNRTDSDKISAAQSGRAMELMNQSLIWLADRLRISYGEGALLNLLRMVVKASEKMPLKFKNGKIVEGIDAKAEIGLRWPDWYQPTADDRQNTATTLKTHVDSGVMSQETATKTIAADYDIEDVAAERAQIEKERQEALANEAALAQSMTQQLPKK